MAPPLKERSSSVIGTWQDMIAPGHPVNIQSFSASRDQLITSVKGRKADHPFEANHGLQTGSIMSGRLGGINFMGCPAAYYSGNAFYNSLQVPNATHAFMVAATNPSRPQVLLPVFWAELRDLPDMLRQAGRIAKRIYFERGSWSNLIRPGHVTKDMAAANIAIQFGWRPLVSDLWKIATLQDQVEKRRKELSKLYSSKGLKRRLEFGSVTTTGTGSAQVWSTHSIGASVPTKTEYTVRSWGTIRWKPTSGMPKWLPTDGQLRRQLTGLSADAILLNLWEALPWSWLVDWFVPIGQTIQGANRTVATPTDGCIMTERRTTTYYEGRRIVQDVLNPWEISPGTKTSVVHHRSIRGDSDLGRGSFPTLGANQLSILGSLVILRNR